jgi:serine phosphatase RsbU (regulator of sigma subunit)
MLGVRVDDGQTRIMTFARSADFTLEDRAHCLELIEGHEAGHRYILGPAGASIGRTSPADIVLADSEVSRTHCRLDLEAGVLTVTDLNSTNGTFIDGVRISAPTPIPVGAILRVGRQSLKHEWLTHREILQQDAFNRDIGKARSYVEALLPPPITQGPFRTDWLFEPSSKLGGDAFGYGALSPTQFMVYMMDVSGHGAGAALHSVAVMNLLRQRALPHADMAEPAQVLAALNRMFPMEAHAGMYFTMWYGIYDSSERQLRYATAGHHPAFLVPADRSQAIGLRTRSGLIGADPATRYTAAATAVTPGASLYLFSDGVFEVEKPDGTMLLEPGLKEMLEAADGEAESRVGRVLAQIRDLHGTDDFADDFSIVEVEFA